MKKFFLSAGGAIKKQYQTKPFLSCLFMGFIMNTLIWLLNKETVGSIFGNLGYYLFNLLIMTAFYLLSLFFKRRLFTTVLVTAVWFALGVTNFVLMGMRDAPLEAIDFEIIRTGLAIVTIYLSTFEIILYSSLILLFIAGLVIFYVKAPKVTPRYAYAIAVFLCCSLTLSLIGLAFIRPANGEKEISADRVGFPYFFLCSVFDRGIDRPDEYSEDTVEKMVFELSKVSTPPPTQTPNVIFVQLESFFDVNRMVGVEFSTDPVPNFSRLLKNHGSGLFRVKSIGSGTANTEFEVLSGLDLELFGVGEYPYTSVLGNNCCETVAYDLAELGYATHAFHNHTATFYDRHKVYANLGFDSYTAAEHMKDIEYNEIGWEKDSILTNYIMKALRTTKERDFVFAVSVQAHGKYPDIPMSDEPFIAVEGLEGERLHEMEFYASQVYETDLFIGELCSALEQFEEDTVLVLYGDHLPTLELSEDEIREGDLFLTDYVVLSNFGFEIDDADISAYELFPRVLDALDIKNGFINKAHSLCRNDEDFKEKLGLLGYDTLYGRCLAYGGKLPFLPTDMVMGIEEISISDVKPTEDGFFVYGCNFTPSSSIFLGIRRPDTVFIDENTLFAEGVLPQYGDGISVVQISSDFRRLSQTEEFIFTRGFLD